MTDFKDTYKKMNKFKDAFVYKAIADNESTEPKFYLAKSWLSEILETAFHDVELNSKLNKWLTSGSTLVLKEIFPEKDLLHFNAIDMLDSVMANK